MKIFTPLWYVYNWIEFILTYGLIISGVGFTILTLAAYVAYLMRPAIP